MIYSLRRKFILICTASFLTVLLIMIGVIFASNRIKQNNMIDMMCDIISENGGAFPEQPTPEFNNIEHSRPMPDFIDQETPFSIRYFIVYYDKSERISKVDTTFISSVSEENAKQWADIVVEKNKERGWYNDYRYKIYETNGNPTVVFINGSMFRSMNIFYMLSTAGTFAISGLAVVVLIIILSKFAVRPAAESYEKQKQFVTDANHELKTPLTLILTNVDIAESELGKNEWLDDIRYEGQQMSALVNKLVTLSRMDEEKQNEGFESFNLSEAVNDVYSEFSELANLKGKKISSEIIDKVLYYGSESEVRQLVSILLDNAIKYCDESGEIRLEIHYKKHPVITVSNTFDNVNKTDLDKLFDRFYRSDKARTSGSGFGIGLSIAQSIVHRHHGDIRAIRKDDNTICFRIKL